MMYPLRRSEIYRLFNLQYLSRKHKIKLRKRWKSGYYAITIRRDASFVARFYLSKRDAKIFCNYKKDYWYCSENDIVIFQFMRGIYAFLYYPSTNPEKDKNRLRSYRDGTIIRLECLLRSGVPIDEINSR